MKKIIFTLLVVSLLCGCGQSVDEKARPLLQRIESLYGEGRYAEALDSIRSLRVHHPDALESRKRALAIWHDASMKQAQAEIIRTDSLLEATMARQKTAGTRLEYNMLGVKIDSLRTQLDAQSMVVRAAKKQMDAARRK